jgi:xanthine dehydrogenase YagR molybdenum-binding subunit
MKNLNTGDSLTYKEQGRPLPGAKPADAGPASAETFKYIGGYLPRVDGKLIVTGKAAYIHDLQMEGMLTAKILRSPYACAEIVALDLSPALALGGVKAAVRLKEGRLNYLGEPVAAVAAEDEATAEEALGLIKVEYRELPFVVSEDASQAEGAPQVLPEGPNVQKLNELTRGDVDKGFREADLILERTYRTSWEVHQPAETHASLAHWEGDSLTVWDSTQAVHRVRDSLAQALKMPAAKVRVIKKYMGGGFGSKLGLNDHTVAAALLARETQRPVKIVLSRRENSYCVGFRPSNKITIKAGVKKDGTLTAVHLKNFTCGGLGRGDDCADPLVDLYRCPNLKVEEYSVFAHTCPNRPMRAPGHTQGIFALEGIMEELAAELGMDPLELRLKNYTNKNQGDTGQPYSTKGLEQCYKLGAEKIGWTRRNLRPGQAAGRVKRGLGMASQIWPGAGVPGTLADLTVYPDGSVEVQCGTQDIGCGTRTYMAAIAADTLSLEPEDITIKIGDSDYPYAPSSGGSLTAPSVGPAVRDAALKAVEQLKNLAAKKLNIPAEQVAVGNKKFANVQNSSQALTFAETARELRRETVFHGERALWVPGFDYQTFGAQFAEVEVDTETGRIRVLRVVAVHDSGRILNRQTAESQVLGGVLQGVSAALFEQKTMDNSLGRMVNANFHDYKVATIEDCPEIIPLFADVVDERLNNLGNKGLGEPPRIPSSAVVANAVFNATGVHVGEIPMTPDKVLQALKRKEERS